MNKKTIVVGASTNPERYAFKAVSELISNQHEVVALGIKTGEIEGVTIQTDRPTIKDVNTVTLYLNPQRQEDWYTYIISLHPKRIIFNPGTENKAFEKMANAHGIETIEACTLVMLNTGQY